MSVLILKRVMRLVSGCLKVGVSASDDLEEESSGA